MMRRPLINWLIGVVAVMVTIKLADVLGLVMTWNPPWRIIIFVPVLAITNAVLGPLVKMFSLPITCLTLGLFGIVVNGLLFWLAGWATGARMSFLSALFGSVCVSLVSSSISWLNKEKKR